MENNSRLVITEKQAETKEIDVQEAKRSLQTKSLLVATRVTPHIRNAVAMMARMEGLTISEWLRNLIVVELKKQKALPFLAISNWETLHLNAEK